MEKVIVFGGDRRSKSAIYALLMKLQFTGDLHFGCQTFLPEIPERGITIELVRPIEFSEPPAMFIPEIPKQNFTKYGKPKNVNKFHR
jgi:hypothetical protein